MMRLDQSSMRTDKLTTSFGWKGRQEVVQHDVQELNRILFAAIEQVGSRIFYLYLVFREDVFVVNTLL